MRQLAVGAHPGRARRKRLDECFLVAVMAVEAEPFVDADRPCVVAMHIQRNRLDVAGEKIDEGLRHG